MTTDSGSPAFIVCGQALFDFLQTANGEGPGAPVRFEARPGGAPFNVVRALNKLGTGAALLAGVSEDFLGARLIATMEAEGLSTDFVKRVPAPTTINLVGESSSGGPTHALRSVGAAEHSLQLSDLPESLGNVRGVGFGGYTMVTQPVSNTYLALAKRECDRRLIALDPNVRLAVESRAEVWCKRFDEFRRFAHVIKASREDLACLAPEVEVELVAEEWLRDGCRMVVITSDREGAAAWTASAHAAVPAMPVTVVDAVGAGDVFHTALLHRLLELGHPLPAKIQGLTNNDLEELLRFAAVAASLVCTRRGVQPPSRAELQSALRA